MVIGFCGFAFSGKDTAAEPLIERGFQRIAFADPLKARAARALGISVDEVNARKRELRPFLVELGRAGRLLDPDMWVDLAFYDRLITNVVVTDVRYLNEVRTVLDMDGVVVFINRPGANAANDEERESIAEILRHCYLPVIHNDGTIEQLHRRVLERYA